MNRVDPTISIEESASRIWDVIVIGAGPAGSTSAIELARRGRSVLLVDRATFPRYKVCGCCLNQRALRAIANCGLLPALRRYGAAGLSELHARSIGHAQAAIRIPESFAVSRSVLDAELIRAAIDAGASFLDATNAKVGSPSADGNVRQVTLSTIGGGSRDARASAARFVIAADGLTSPSTRALVRDSESGCDERVARRNRVGGGCIIEMTDALGALCPPGRIVMSCAPHGYVGLARIEHDQVVCAAACDLDRLEITDGGWNAVAAEIASAAGASDDVANMIESARWRGTPPLNRSRPRITLHRLVFVGDSAGYVEPFTGEGIGWAMGAAQRAASVVSDMVESYDEGALAAWAHNELRITRRQKRICRIVSRLVRSRVLTSATIRALRVAPRAATPLVRRMNGVRRMSPKLGQVSGL